jgi:hypothetical protein
MQTRCVKRVQVKTDSIKIDDLIYIPNGRRFFQIKKIFEGDITVSEILILLMLSVQSKKVVYIGSLLLLYAIN